MYGVAAGVVPRKAWKVVWSAVAVVARVPEGVAGVTGPKPMPYKVIVAPGVTVRWDKDGGCERDGGQEVGRAGAEGVGEDKRHAGSEGDGVGYFDVDLCGADVRDERGFAADGDADVVEEGGGDACGEVGTLPVAGGGGEVGAVDLEECAGRGAGGGFEGAGGHNAIGRNRRGLGRGEELEGGGVDVIAAVGAVAVGRVGCDVDGERSEVGGGGGPGEGDGVG